MCLSGVCDMETFENHCFRQFKTAGRQPAFSSSELNIAQHGFDRLSACMLSLWNDRTISPCSWWKERESMWQLWANMKMMGKSTMWDAKCFPPLNRVNFKAVIANLIHELCDTLSHGKVVCCLSVCRLEVRDDNIWEQGLHHTSHWIHYRLWRQPENCF